MEALRVFGGMARLYSSQDINVVFQSPIYTTSLQGRQFGLAVCCLLAFPLSTFNRHISSKKKKKKPVLLTNRYDGNSPTIHEGCGH